MFRSIAKLWRPKDDEIQQRNYGLTGADIELLRGWWSDENAREVYARALDIAAKLQAEILLYSRDDAALHEARGVVLGLRRAATLVDEIIQSDVRFADAERDRAAGDIERADGRIRALYGTPSWRAVSL